jgi:hypothetical protein
MSLDAQPQPAHNVQGLRTVARCPGKLDA